MQQQRDKTDRAYNKIATGLKLVHIRIILFAYLYTITTTILLLLVRIILTFFLSHLNLWQRLWRRSHLLHSLAQLQTIRSFTANSAKIFLSKHTLSTPIPRINSAYFTPCSRLAALIRTIHSFLASRFFVRRSLYAYCKAFSTLWFATRKHSARPLNPFASANIFSFLVMFFSSSKANSFRGRLSSPLLSTLLFRARAFLLESSSSSSSFAVFDVGERREEEEYPPHTFLEMCRLPLL